MICFLVQQAEEGGGGNLHQIRADLLQKEATMMSLSWKGGLLSLISLV